MNDSTHNGDHDIRPGDTGQQEGDGEPPKTADNPLGFTDADREEQHRQASTMPIDLTGADPIDGLAAPGDEPTVDQPEPPPDTLKAVEDTPKGDVLITLSEVDGEIRMQQMLSVDKPDMGNPAHFFGQWFSRNYPMLVQMASVEFNLNQALREERSKHRLRLVSADGQTPLVE